MPYTRDEAQEFTRKATTAAARRQWEHVFQKCIKRGCTEGEAIRQANAAVKARPRPDPLPVIEGVQVFDLGSTSPADLHSAIADAIGED